MVFCDMFKSVDDISPKLQSTDGIQHHQTPEMKANAKSLGEDVLDYDGCAQLWVRDWDAWLAFYNSKEYGAALGPDCERFMALPMTYMVGYENVIVGSGVVGGKDGLKPGS